MSQEIHAARGLRVHRRAKPLPFEDGIDFIVDALDDSLGTYFSSGVEYPGRYSRHDFGFMDPPIEFVGRCDRLTVSALNPRGRPLLKLLKPLMIGDGTIVEVEDETAVILRVPPTDTVFPEEERSCQPTVLSPVRRLIDALAGIDDPYLGVYGAFGYDLIFAFQGLERTKGRDGADKDLHLFLPDRIYAVDRRLEIAHRYDYVFSDGEGTTTRNLPRRPFAPLPATPTMLPAGGGINCDQTDDAYAAQVDRARDHMVRGDIFELALSRTFSAPCPHRPSALYRAIRKINPSPYEFLIQLGDEQLVGASPEMFVRVDGNTVESCPIAGTVRRGADPMEDADRLRSLYNSDKDEAELTMCTDVDRNDKARICKPGTVRLVDRRLVERYAGLFHTVDHVKGTLRAGLTGVDAFLSHMWAATLTGAPKTMAVRLIEAYEEKPRAWYGGAVGALQFNGGVNTAITIRTINLRDGIACYRAGASLVYDSDGQAEADETRTKATAFYRLLAPPEAASVSPAAGAGIARPAGPRAHVVMIDNEDSFVHTLADYFRQAGADVVTYRWTMPDAVILAAGPDLIVHSPGPGHPADFRLPERVTDFADRGIAQFGVCLGLQGMVCAYGGAIEQLPEPRHGKSWTMEHMGTDYFDGLPSPCSVGAYHSLATQLKNLPEHMEATAWTVDGLVMAARHRQLPLSGVQFHPESILSLHNEFGLKLTRNVLLQTKSRLKRVSGRDTCRQTASDRTMSDTTTPAVE